MKKSSIILSLLALTAALAALPALGELTYLKKNTPYIEKVPIKEITSLVSNNHAKIENLLDDNKNTEWISWKETRLLKEDYDEANRYFSNISIDDLGTKSSTTGNYLLTVSGIETTPQGQEGLRQYRQFRLFDNLNLQKDLKYSLRVRYRGTIASNGTNNRVKVALGDFTNESATNLDVSTDWVVKEIEFDNLPSDINPGFCSMQPGYYEGMLEVDWAVLSYLDPEASPTNLYDYSTISTIPETAHGREYITIENGILTESYEEPNTDPTKAAWVQFDATPTFKLKPNTTYSIKVNIKGGDNKTAVQCWVGTTNWPPLDIAPNKSLSYNNTDFSYSTITFTTPPVADIDQKYLDAEKNINNVVLRIQPGTYPDKIEIKSVEIYEYTTEYNNGEDVIPGWDTTNAKYTKSEDGIIYSYPLPGRRKVIVGHDGSLKFVENKTYAVTYGIKYSVNGTVTTQLHNTNGSTAIVTGESDAITIEAGQTKNVRSSILANVSTTENQAGAVVLDLGYNVGDVEVSNLRVYDITTSIPAKDSSTVTHRSEAGPIDLTGNMTTQLVEVMNGLTLRNEETYTVTVKLKATKAGSLCMKLGRAFPEEGTRRVINQNFNGPGEGATVSDWQLLTFTARPENNDNGTSLNYNGDGRLSLQLQKPEGTDAYDGEVTIQVVKISSSIWKDGETVASINYADVSDYTFGTFRNGESDYPQVKDSKLIIDDYWEILSDGRTNTNIKIPVANGLGT
ncbi:MAG: hypothetical protein K2G77_00270, partial [Muribaculaceae bacterium]|nr:hypothetical protein [Muribaculaceae bacterium]